jgi:hypothetical protein
MALEVVNDWLKIIKNSVDSARIAPGIGVRRLKNGRPSAVTLEPTGEVEINGKQVFNATLLHEGGVIDGGEVVSDIPLNDEELLYIQQRNKEAIQKYKSLI